MIVANVRRQLTRRDAQLAARLIAGESAQELDALETRLRDEGIDSLLDDARLLRAILTHPLGAAVSFPLFAYVAVRSALQRLGEGDRAVADYASAVMLEFNANGRATRVGLSDDETYETLFELLDDVDDPDARRSLLVRAHLGNYALWLSGLFADHIEYRRWHRGGPSLDYYEELGRRGFALAADHRLAVEQGLAPLYLRVAERFALVRTALTTVSDQLLFPNVNTPERLMRQVADEARWQKAG
ncbi:MAG TPA: hypothetical protein VFT96_07175 [Gemmatimonadaceae bacterium]|nr:hypothetical protein [Gemmatimonadaceae bacterium]